MTLYLLKYGETMALLVKEQKALEKLEQSFKNYYVVVLGEDSDDLGIDSSKTPEERILHLAMMLDGSY
jgi:hypothetical protein